MDSQYALDLGGATGNISSLEAALALAPAAEPSLRGLDGHSRVSSSVAPALAAGPRFVDAASIRPRSSSSRSLAHAHPFGATTAAPSLNAAPAFTNPWGNGFVEPQAQPEPVRLTQFYPTPPTVRRRSA